MRCIVGSLSQQGNVTQAEDLFVRSMELAERQGARWLQLKASIGYAGLLKAGGRQAEGLARLRACHDWFAEGRETAVMQEARALLNG